MRPRTVPENWRRICQGGGATAGVQEGAQKLPFYSYTSRTQQNNIGFVALTGVQLQGYEQGVAPAASLNGWYWFLLPPSKFRRAGTQGQPRLDNFRIVKSGQNPRRCAGMLPPNRGTDLRFSVSRWVVKGAKKDLFQMEQVFFSQCHGLSGREDRGVYTPDIGLAWMMVS